jgi:hypothetical protein
MGEGVRLVSSEPVKGDAGWEGVKATFAFDDINKIQVSEGPSTGSRPRSAEPTSSDPVRFKLTRSGGTSTLSINFIDVPISDKAAAAPRQPSDMPDLTNPMIMNTSRPCSTASRSTSASKSSDRSSRPTPNTSAAPRTRCSNDVASMPMKRS